MNNVNKTLYIPLYGKSYVSKRGIILSDTKAEEIWQAEGFPLKGKAASKWLAFYMGMRAAAFDRWTAKQLRQLPEACVLHLGCGMDSRCLRVGDKAHIWYDIDFPDVIGERKKYFAETANYRMVGMDVRNLGFTGEAAVVILEGISMYLTREELLRLLEVGNGNPLQYSCLKNPMDRGAWRAVVHGVAKSIYSRTKRKFG